MYKIILVQCNHTELFSFFFVEITVLQMASFQVPNYKMHGTRTVTKTKLSNRKIIIIIIINQFLPPFKETKTQQRNERSTESKPLHEQIYDALTWSGWE